MDRHAENVSRELQDRLRFESMLADLSSRFVNLEAESVDQEIEDAQRRVCECLGLDMSALWQLPSEDTGQFWMSHLYRPPGGPLVPEIFDAREVNPWGLKQILAGRAFSLHSINDAPAEAAADIETWRYFGIKSVFCFPLSTGGEIPIGAVSFHGMQEQRSWPDEIVHRLSLVSEIFANALLRRRSDAALRESEERLKLAAESAEIGMWALDVESQRFWANERGREIFGFSADSEVTLGAVPGFGAILVPRAGDRGGSKGGGGGAAGRHRVPDRTPG